MFNLAKSTKIILILCLTAIVLGIIRAVIVGALTVDDILKIIGAWEKTKALIHGI